MADELSEKQVGTEPSTNRLEAFSDGVFAIAITILVLQLGVPEVSTALPHDRVAAALSAKLLELWPGKLVSYALSFVIVGMFWVAHHMVFQHVRRADRALLWLNILFLLLVSFIPFPAGLLGRYFDQRLALVIYAAALGVTGLSLELVWRYAVRGRRLVDHDLDPALAREVSRKNLTAPAVAAAAAALSIVSVRAGFVLLVLVPALFLLPSRVPRRSHHPRRPGHAGHAAGAEDGEAAGAAGAATGAHR